MSLIPLSAPPLEALDEPTSPPELALLRVAVTALDDRRRALAEAGDLPALGLGLAGLRKLIGDLRQLERDVETDLAERMVDGRLVIEATEHRPGLILERHRAAERTEWESDRLLVDLVRLALDPDNTGELPATPWDAVDRVVGVLAACVPFTKSLGWRTTALKAHGVNVAAYRTRTFGRWTVQTVAGGGEF